MNGFFAAVLAAALALAAILAAARDDAPGFADLVGRDGRVCFVRGVALFAGVGRCFAPREARALMEAPISDGGAQPLSLTLSPPAEVAAAPASVSTCAEHQALTARGWAAISSADMRREAFFRRACAAARAMRAAAPASTSPFGRAGLGRDDIAALSDLGFGVGERSGAAAVESAGSGADWRLKGEDFEARIQQIAHADFTGDGAGDVLVFITIIATDGTAEAARAGLVVKETRAARPRFVPLP